MLLWINNLKGKEPINSDKIDKQILLITRKTEISASVKNYMVYVFQDYNYTRVLLVQTCVKEKLLAVVNMGFQKQLKKYFRSS